MIKVVGKYIMIRVEGADAIYVVKVKDVDSTTLRGTYHCINSLGVYDSGDAVGAWGTKNIRQLEVIK